MGRHRRLLPYLVSQHRVQKMRCLSSFLQQGNKEWPGRSSHTSFCFAMVHIYRALGILPLLYHEIIKGVEKTGNVIDRVILLLLLFFLPLGGISIYQYAESEH